jgi:hypothetical protein
VQAREDVNALIGTGAAVSRAGFRDTPRRGGKGTLLPFTTLYHSARGLDVRPGLERVGGTPLTCGLWFTKFGGRWY